MTSLALLLTLAGCDRNGDDIIALDWTLGETFHLAARYRHASLKAEGGAVGLDGLTVPELSETWSDDVVWTYQVVEQGFVPPKAHELRRFVGKDDQSLAVVKATVDPELNDDPMVLEADPVVYMVFREGRDRMVGLVAYENVDGERQERAWDAGNADRSYNVLSQSNLSLAPTYLAPFGTRWSDASLTLENGSLVDSVSGEGFTDVVFDDELGGGLVSARYEDDRPWPTWTVTDNLEVELLDDDEVRRRRGQGFAPLPTEPEDFDYVEALATAIDLGSSLQLDAETMASGWSAEVREAYTPWAGNWWPQSKGGLVFGYGYRDTLSEGIQDDVVRLQNDIDSLKNSLRDMDDTTTAAYDEKLTKLQDTQTELIELLVGFYDQVQADLDGGQMVIEGDELVRGDERWKLEELSPMDKLALAEHLSGTVSHNSFYLPAWELLNHHSPGSSWWGHCNGWAAAAILIDEPREDVTTTIGGVPLTFTHADIKGLMSEAHYATYSHFYGERYDGPEDDISDLSPKAFHQLVTYYLRDQGIPLVFDTSADEQVWNYPASGAEVRVTERPPAEGSDKLNLNTATADELATLEAIDDEEAAAIVSFREWYGPFQSVEELQDVGALDAGDAEAVADEVTVAAISRVFDVVATVTIVTDNVSETHLDSATPASFIKTWSYSLTTDADGVVVGGDWVIAEEHPDFAWVPFQNPVAIGSGGSENEFLRYDFLLDTVGDELTRR